MPTRIPKDICASRQVCLVYRDATTNDYHIKTGTDEYSRIPLDGPLVSYDITKECHLFMVEYNKKEKTSTLQRWSGVGDPVFKQDFKDTCFHSVAAINDSTCLTLESKGTFLKKFFGFGTSAMKIFNLNKENKFDIPSYFELSLQLKKYIPLYYSASSDAEFKFISGIGCDNNGYLYHIFSPLDIISHTNLNTKKTKSYRPFDNITPIHIHLPGDRFEKQIKDFQVHVEPDDGSCKKKESLAYTIIVETVDGKIIIAQRTYAGGVRYQLRAQGKPGNGLKIHVAFIEGQYNDSKIVPAHLVVPEKTDEPPLAMQFDNDNWTSQSPVSESHDRYMRFVKTKKNAFLIGTGLFLFWILHLIKSRVWK